ARAGLDREGVLRGLPVLREQGLRTDEQPLAPVHEADVGERDRDGADDDDAGAQRPVQVLDERHLALGGEAVAVAVAHRAGSPWVTKLYGAQGPLTWSSNPWARWAS